MRRRMCPSRRRLFVVRLYASICCDTIPPMIKRRKSRKLFIGDVPVGADAPVTVQSMTKTPTADVDATVRQARSLARAGCHIIRVAVPDLKAARAIAAIVPRIPIPLVADIHFSAELALEAIKSGSHAIRINPGNMRNWRDVRSVVTASKKAGIPIRIGVNSGSIRPRKGWEVSSKRGDMVTLMVDTVLKYCERFEEKYGFGDIKISLKTADAVETIECYRRIAKRCDYPLHLGLTSAGPVEDSEVKSSIVIGGLLAEGLGDTIRVSSTGRPLDEVRIGHRILGALRLKPRGLEVHSCPTCGRCKVNLEQIVRAVKKATAHIDRDITIAVMGCVVNGPGEAAQADIGVACANDCGWLFRGGKKIRRVPAADIARSLVEYIEKM